MKISSRRVIPIPTTPKKVEDQKIKEKYLKTEAKNILSPSQIAKIRADALKRRFQLSPSRNSTNERKKCSLNQGDEQESISSGGTMQQYCLKGIDVILRSVHYIRNDRSNMLLITIDNAKRKTDTYNILLTKEVCPYNFKDSDAFVIKVVDVQQRLKSMTFKADGKEGKGRWIRSYGINMEMAQILLDSCIEEVERRRFHLGIKKRNEEQNKIKMTTDILVNLLHCIKESMKINLTDETRWTVTNLERLVQILLNEITEPLIPYEHQKAIRKSEHVRFNASSETKKLLNTLCIRNKMMLISLLAHMERLSKYYLIVMSSPRHDLPRIRQNICQRLAPMIFRLQEGLDSDAIVNKSIDLLYHTMLCVTGNS